MSDGNERVSQFSLADIRVLLNELDDKLKDYFHASANQDGDFITRFVAVLAWIQFRSWIVFSPHDNKILKELADQIGCKLIKQSKANGVEGAPINEKRIVCGTMVPNPNDKKGLN